MNGDRVVLGVHPFARGFGWIVFEAPNAPVDWGVVERRTSRNVRCLAAVHQILLRNRPCILVLEAFERPSKYRAPRIRRLCRSIVTLAQTHAVEVCVHPPGDIRAAFGAVSATRHDIATSVAQRVEPIRSRLPTKRAIWESEKAGMALFNAAAVGLTCYAAHGQLTLL